MRSKIFRSFVINLISFSLLSLGLAQTASAGMIGTQQVIQSEARGVLVTRVEATLARADVASQLVLFGVDPQAVQTRISNMTDAELIALDGRLDQQTAGGSVVAIVGAVFIVLIILELVGITDIFKSA